MLELAFKSGEGDVSIKHSGNVKSAQIRKVVNSHVNGCLIVNEGCCFIICHEKKIICCEFTFYIAFIEL